MAITDYQGRVHQFAHAWWSTVASGSLLTGHM